MVVHLRCDDCEDLNALARNHTAPRPLVAVSPSPRRADAGNHGANSRRAPNGCDLRARNRERICQRQVIHGKEIAARLDSRFWGRRSYYGKPRQNGQALTPRWRDPLETWWVAVRASHVC
jgi:hypothetical protein